MAVRTRPSDGRALPVGVRIRPAGADPSTVHITVTEPRAVGPDAARRLAAALHATGGRRIVTNALPTANAAPFLAAGFVVREELDVLARALDDVPRPTVRTRRPRNRAVVVALDERAFGEHTFDVHALDDACQSTPMARLRVTGAASSPTGYVVTGVAGARAYLQRLAVEPDARRGGLATALAHDGLRWAHRRGARTAVVNTHVENQPAHALYTTLGFTPLPSGLVVLERTQ
jgi:ribosomal-protein-alanine N-acetyltransferase